MLLEAIAYVIYIRHKCCCCCCCSLSQQCVQLDWLLVVLKIKIDAQRGALRFREGLTIEDVLVSSNFTLFHPNDILTLDDCELYPMDEKKINDFLIGK